MLCETNAIAFDSLQCNGHISVSQFTINSHPGEASFPEKVLCLNFMTTFLFAWMPYFIKGVVVVLALWFCNRILIKVNVGFDKKKSKSNYSHDRKLFFENYIKLHI
jgi:hypothetical protein